MSRLSSSLGNTMKTMTGRTLIALGVASCLGIGTAVYAQTNATALPPPDPAPRAPMAMRSAIPCRKPHRGANGALA